MKAPKSITHEAKLRDIEGLVAAFLDQIEPMREKAGPILFQLPPSLAFHSEHAENFLSALRTLYKREAVLEPRHATWFSSAANDLLKKYRIARVAADPPRGAFEAGEPGGETNFMYYRLHGYPRTYYSNYEDDFLASLAAKIKPEKDVWIIFDNTALSHAYDNALLLQNLVMND